MNILPLFFSEMHDFFLAFEKYQVIGKVGNRSSLLPRIYEVRKSKISEN